MNEKQATQQKAELDQQVLQKTENLNKVIQYFIIIKNIKILKTNKTKQYRQPRIKWNFQTLKYNYCKFKTQWMDYQRL